MALISTAKSGAGHCWVLALAIAPPRAPFGGGGDRTSRSYGMDKPIWDILHVPGGAGYGTFEKSGSGRTPGPQNPLSACDVIERPCCHVFCLGTFPLRLLYCSLV